MADFSLEEFKRLIGADPVTGGDTAMDYFRANGFAKPEADKPAPVATMTVPPIDMGWADFSRSNNVAAMSSDGQAKMFKQWRDSYELPYLKTYAPGSEADYMKRTDQEVQGLGLLKPKPTDGSVPLDFLKAMAGGAVGTVNSLYKLGQRMGDYAPTGAGILNTAEDYWKDTQSNQSKDNQLISDEARKRASDAAVADGGGTFSSIAAEFGATLRNLNAADLGGLAGSVATSFLPGGAVGKAAQVLSAGANTARAAMIAGNTLGGAAIEAGGAVGDAYERITKMPEDQLRSLPMFQAMQSSNPNMPVAQIRESLAMEASRINQKGTALAASMGGIGGAFGAFGLGGKTKLGKVATELISEPITEGITPIGTNLNIASVSPTQNLYEGVGQAAALGLIGGAGGASAGTLEKGSSRTAGTAQTAGNATNNANTAAAAAVNISQTAPNGAANGAASPVIQQNQYADVKDIEAGAPDFTAWAKQYRASGWDAAQTDLAAMERLIVTAPPELQVQAVNWMDAEVQRINNANNPANPAAAPSAASSNAAQTSPAPTDGAAANPSAGIDQPAGVATVQADGGIATNTKTQNIAIDGSPIVQSAAINSNEPQRQQPTASGAGDGTNGAGLASTGDVGAQYRKDTGKVEAQVQAAPTAPVDTRTPAEIAENARKTKIKARQSTDLQKKNLDSVDDPFLRWAIEKGIRREEQGGESADFNPLVAGVGHLFRLRGGYSLDSMVEMAIEDGFLPENSGQNEIQALIAKSQAGGLSNPVYSQDFQDKIEREAMTDAQLDAAIAATDNLTPAQRALEPNPRDPLELYDLLGYDVDSWDVLLQPTAKERNDSLLEFLGVTQKEYDAQYGIYDNQRAQTESSASATKANTAGNGSNTAQSEPIARAPAPTVSTTKPASAELTLEQQDADQTQLRLDKAETIKYEYAELNRMGGRYEQSIERAQLNALKEQASPFFDEWTIEDLNSAELLFNKAEADRKKSIPQLSESDKQRNIDSEKYTRLQNRINKDYEFLVPVELTNFINGDALTVSQAQKIASVFKLKKSRKETDAGFADRVEDTVRREWLGGEAQFIQAVLSDKQKKILSEHPKYRGYDVLDAFVRKDEYGNIEDTLTPDELTPQEGRNDATAPLFVNSQIGASNETNRTTSNQPFKSVIRGNIQPADGLQSKTNIDGEFFENTILGITKEQLLGTSKILDAADLATATQYLYQSAVERVDGVVTDKNGKPLAVVGGFKGNQTSSSVYFSTIVSEAIQVDGAANLWISHNHPSGDEGSSQLSSADYSLSLAMERVLRGSGINFKGLIAISGNEFSSDNGIVSQIIADPTESYSVNAVERIFTKTAKTPIVTVENKQDYAQKLYDTTGKTSLILTNSRGAIVAVPQIDGLDSALREGALNTIYKAISQSNAYSALIVMGKQGDSKNIQSANNIYKALKGVGVSTIDAYMPFGGGKEVSSIRNLGLLNESDTSPFFSQSDTTKPTNPSTVTAIRSAIEGIFGNTKGVWDSISKSTVIVATRDDVPVGAVSIGTLKSLPLDAQNDLLSQYTREEALAKQAREEQAAKDAGRTAPAVRGKSFKTEQVDLFNPQNALFSQSDALAQAFYDPPTGKIYMIADRIQKGTEAAVWLHEVSHKQLLPLLGKENLAKLHGAVTSWRGRKEGTVERAIYEAANSRAEKAANELTQSDKETVAQFKARKQELYNGEFLAYAIEEAVNRGVTPDATKGTISAQGWMAKVKQLFEGALAKLIGKPSTLSANDLVAMAYGAAQLELQGKNAGGNGNVQASLTPFDGAEQARTPLGDTKTVTVDGTEYSVFNNLGKPIHQTVEGVRNFWRWFSADGVTDKNGAPLVLYRSGREEINSATEQATWFSTNKSVAATYGNAQQEFYVKLGNSDYVNARGRTWDGIDYEGGAYSTDSIADNVKAIGYDGLHIENVIDGAADSKKTDAGVVSDIYVTFGGNSQFKSATGNNGDFSPANNDITRSIAPDGITSYAAKRDAEHLAAYLANDEAAGQALVDIAASEANYPSGENRVEKSLDPFTFDDAGNLIPLSQRFDNTNQDVRYSLSNSGKDVQDALNAAIPNHAVQLLPPKAERDVQWALREALVDYQAPVARMLEKVYGFFNDAPLWQSLKTYATKRDALHENFSQGLRKQMEANANAIANATGMDVREAASAVGEYAKARHIPDANRELQSRGLNTLAGNMTDATAQAVMTALESKIDKKLLIEGANHLVNANLEGMQMAVDANLMTAAQQQSLLQKYPNYVPLLMADVNEDPFSEFTRPDMFSASMNANIAKAMKGYGIGSDKVAENGYVNTLAKRAAIHARIASQDFKLAALAMSRLPAGSAHVESAKITAASQQLDPKGMAVRDPQTGEWYSVKFKDESVQDAIYNRGVESPDTWLQAMAIPTRLIAKGVTQWIMLFAPINTLRDVQAKAVQVRARKYLDTNGNAIDSKKLGFAVLKYAASPELWRAAAEIAFKKTPANPSPMYLRLKAAADGGALSTWGDFLNKSKEDAYAELQHTAGARKVAKHVSEAVEMWNTWFDTISSFAAYTALTDAGVAPKAAQFHTLDLMNFRNKGKKTAFIRSFYVFANANIQDAANLSQDMKTKQGRSDFVALTVIAAGLYAMSKAIGGEPDDAEERRLLGSHVDQRGTYEAERSLSLCWAKDACLKVPVGFGKPMLAWTLAANSSRAASGRYSPGEAIGETAKAVIKTFAPTGYSEVPITQDPSLFFMSTLAPTIAKPLVNVATNKTAFGSDLANNRVKDKYASENAKASTEAFWVDAAKSIRRLIGFDVAPEKVREVWRSLPLVAGPIAEFEKALTNNKAERGVPTDIRDDLRYLAPLGLNRVLGGDSRYLEAAYYERVREGEDLAKRLNVEVPQTARPRRGQADRIWAERVKRLDATEQEKALLLAYREENGNRKELKEAKQEMQAKIKNQSPNDALKLAEQFNDETRQSMLAFLKASQWKQ